MSRVRTDLIDPLQKKYTDVQSLLTKVNLENKVAIVTGGNTGLGFEIIKSLVACGAHVILATRNDKRGFECVLSSTPLTQQDS